MRRLPTMDSPVRRCVFLVVLSHYNSIVKHLCASDILGIVKQRDSIIILTLLHDRFILLYPKNAVV